MIYVEFSGGLGNQMFAYAFGRAMGLRYGEPVTLLDREEWRDGAPAHTVCALRQFDLSPRVAIVPRTADYKRRLPVQNLAKVLMIKHEQRAGMMADWSAFERRMAPLLNLLGTHFVSDGYLPPNRRRFPKNFLAWGYFQSPAYFDAYKEQLQAEFTLTGEPSQSARALGKAIEVTACPVCLHWRCGDYLQPENAALNVCSPAYYRRACQAIAARYPRATLFVFSDDPAYVRDHLDSGGLPVIYPRGERSAAEDLSLMQKCRHFIISNSTFSWWGQYLAPCPQKTVLAPDRWFANGRKSGLYQPGWELIDTESI